MALFHKRYVVNLLMLAEWTHLSTARMRMPAWIDAFQLAFKRMGFFPTLARPYPGNLPGHTGVTYHFHESRAIARPMKLQSCIKTAGRAKIVFRVLVWLIEMD